ncbi:MAG TPA: efflux RND transporter periplasmic adaptor subunit [Chitinophagales bacterium]|jgi:membrane fusion protein (multidrug efflux system)|nr:efflux RND transporter periplasmic adaptor subunit [Chitinophagales bacterium]HQO88645.1 efflux RND transporter periplasmic adaptor subunit [Chitinophagales bacterium]
MSKGKWIAGILAVSVVAGLSYVKIKNNQKAAANMPMGKGPGGGPMTVSGFVASYSKLSNTLNVTGSILASDEVQLQPEISGRVTYLNIPEGSAVSKGTLLVKLNDADLQAQLKKLQAQLKIAQSNEQRLATLLKTNGVAQQEYDAALNTLNNVEADIELLKAQIDKTEIRAPFSGRLGLRNISMGAMVTPATVVTTLQNLSVLKMDVTLPEKYAGVIGINDMMQCSVDGVDEPFSARVIAIEPQIDELTRNLKVRALVQAAGKKLVPGAFVKVKLKLKDIQNAVLIPANAIIPDAKSKKVIIADSSKAKFVVVETGYRTENEVQILSGINPGDTIVTSGLLQLKPATPVKFSKVNSVADIQ